MSAAVIMMALTLAASKQVYANPTGGQVKAGTAVIGAPDSKTVEVTQASHRAIIEWKGFSIAADEATRFVQPSSSSVVLNRVIGGDPSRIFGSLKANGQVLLINGSGILFGPTARIDVAGLVASTADIRNDDFMAGRMKFDIPGRPGAAVVNQGDITVAANGLVALVAPGVENTGRIHAKLGRVALASGERFTVDLYGDGLVSFAVGDKVAAGPAFDADGRRLGARVANRGEIFADGGTVILTAAAASAIVDSAINMDGVIQARTAGTRGGVIVLEAGDAGGVSVAGRLDATGAAGMAGGKITVTGSSVDLAATARLDASGDTGGGTILVGGGPQGIGLQHNSLTTTIAAGATLNANAVTSGDGGTIIAWANDHGSYAGLFSARGGSTSGNGGFIETSGKTVDFAPSLSVSASAANGTAGKWLIDPADITIDSTLAATLAGVLAAGTSTEVTTSSGSGGNGDLTLAASINAAATNGADLTLTGRHLSRTGSNTVNISGTGSSLILNVNAVNANPNPTGTWIQDAVNMIGNVSGGTTVNLGAGTYAMASSINVDKGIAFLGPNAGTHGTSASRVAEAVIIGGNPSGPSFRLDTASPVTFDGLKFEGGVGGSIDNQGGSGAHGSVVLRNNVFSNLPANPFFSNPTSLTIERNRFTNVGAPAPFQQSIQVAGNWNGTTGSSVTILDNLFESSTGAGLNLSNVSGLISGNTFTNLAFYGILLANNSSSISVTNNLFDHITNPGSNTTHGAGIRFFDPAFTGPVVISGNEFANSVIGVSVRAGSNLTGMNVQITGNSFHDNGQAIRHEGTGLLNASGNWWGTTSETAVAALVTGTGPVDFTPYLASGTDSNLATPGFQGNLNNIYVTALGAQNGSTGRIQEGVDLVNAGGIVNVAAGTYTESVNINKSMDLLGNQAGVNPNGGNWNDIRTNAANESTIRGAVNLSLRNNIVVDGFTIERTDANEGHILIGSSLPGGSGIASGFNIRNNRIIGSRDTASPGSPWAGIHTNFLNDNTLPGAQFVSHQNRIEIAGSASGSGILVNANLPGTDGLGSTTITSTYVANSPGNGFNVNRPGASAIISGNRVVNDDIFTFRANNTVISGNTVIDAPQAAISNTGGSTNWTASGNTIINPRAQAILVGSTFTVDPVSNITIQNNTVTVDPSLVAVGVTTVFSPFQFAYFDMRGNLTGTNTVNSNTLTFNGNPLNPAVAAVYGLRVRGNVGNLTVSNNVLNGNGVGGAGGSTLPPSSAVFVDTDSLASGLNLHVQNNFINGWVNGASVFNTATGSFGGLPGGATVTLFNNSLSANSGFGVASGTGGLVNASGNWWGTTNPSAVAVSGPVDFTPMLGSGTDTNLGTPGFQGNFNSVHVTTLGSQSGSTGRIQEGVDLVNAGGTVNLSAETFNEVVTISKPLTLDGAGIGQTTLRSSALGTGNAVTINNASNVTLSDLTIADYAYGLRMDGTSNDVTVARVAFDGNTYGMRNGTGTKADRFHMLDSSITGGVIGVQTYNLFTSGVATGSFADALFENVSINGPTYKGFYFETANNLVLRNVSITNAGNVGDDLHRFGHAVDVNLKYAAYGSITLDNVVIQNSGHSAGHATRGAVVIKTRGVPGDSSDYTAAPASLQNVNIIGGRIEGSAGTGIRIETMSNGAGGQPTVTIGGGIQLANNGQDIVTENTRVNATGAVFVGAGSNFAIEDRVTHALDHSARNLVTWLAGNLYVTPASGSIQRGLDAASAGNTVNISGTYAENVLLAKDLTLSGTNAAVTSLGSTAGTSIGLSGTWTIGGPVNFAGLVALAGGLSLDTSAVNGPISFQSAITGQGAGGQNLTLNAGSGTVTVQNIGTVGAPIGDLVVSAGNYAGAAGTAYVASLKIDAGDVAVGNSTVHSAGGVTINSTNLSGSIIAEDVTVNATGNVNANIVAENTANINGTNVEGSVQGTNVQVAAVETANTTVVATNTASVSGTNVQGSVQGANVQVVAIETANTTVVATNTASVSGTNVQGSVQAPTATVNASQSVNISANIENLTLSAQSGSVTGHTGSVQIGAGSGLIAVNGESTASVDSGVTRNQSILDPNAAGAGDFVVQAASPASYAFIPSATDVFARDFSLGRVQGASGTPDGDLSSFLGNFWAQILGGHGKGDER